VANQFYFTRSDINMWAFCLILASVQILIAHIGQKTHIWYSGYAVDFDVALWRELSTVLLVAPDNHCQ